LNQMSSNFVIETAFDGYEALMKLGDFKPDLLILDIKMPKIDGFEVCKRIKSSSSLTNTSIFVISAYIDEIGVEKIKDAGADDYLAKPVKLPDLEKKIQKLLKIRVIGTKSGKILI
ncbi:MAG: response regulator, partial [Fidelibacterota bacterium]